MPCNSRVDILTNEYAYEVDFLGKKWAECLTQSLYYAMMTNRKPGMILIIKHRDELKHLRKLCKILKFYGINNVKIITDGIYKSDWHNENCSI